MRQKKLPDVRRDELFVIFPGTFKHVRCDKVRNKIFCHLETIRRQSSFLLSTNCGFGYHITQPLPQLTQLTM